MHQHIDQPTKHAKPHRTHACTHTWSPAAPQATEIYYDPDPKTTIIEEDREWVEGYFDLNEVRAAARVSEGGWGVGQAVARGWVGGGILRWCGRVVFVLGMLLLLACWRRARSVPFQFSPAHPSTHRRVMWM